MNKTLSTVAVLSVLLAGASFAETYDTKPKAKASAPSSLKDAAGIQKKLEALERKTWEGFKSQDFKMMKEVVADDAMSADVNGFATFDQFEPTMKDYAVDSYTLEDWKLLPLGKDAAVLIYTANMSAKYKGESIPSGPYYVSTTYVNRAGKWVALYHQETLAASAMTTATSH